MQMSRLVRWIALLGWMLLAVAQPASATRTVFDSSDLTMTISGYCSPNSCTGFTTPFSVNVGGTSYNNFFANTNGTVSFGSIYASLSQESVQLGQSPYTFVPPPPVTNLSAYQVPIFSPNFSDGSGYWVEPFPGVYDGNFVALTTVGSNSFTVSWYPCVYASNCGLSTLAAVMNRSYDPSIGFDGTAGTLQGVIETWANLPPGACPCTAEQVFDSGKQNFENYLLNVSPRYTMTLTTLSNGFEVDYSYTLGAIGRNGTYGFSLPSGTNQITGPLENVSYFFNPEGHWRQRGDHSDAISQLDPVPEPSTWMMMLLGFAMMGFAIRRKRALRIA